MIEELERILCSHQGLSSKEKKEFFNKFTAQQKKIEELDVKYESAMSWMHDAEGFDFDDAVEAQDQLTASKTLIDQVKGFLKMSQLMSERKQQIRQIQHTIDAIEAFEGGRG